MSAIPLVILPRAPGIAGMTGCGCTVVRCASMVADRAAAGQSERCSAVLAVLVLEPTEVLAVVAVAAVAAVVAAIRVLALCRVAAMPDTRRGSDRSRRDGDRYRRGRGGGGAGGRGPRGGPR